MNQVPRNETLAEALYRDIDKDEYLNEIYGDLLYNYSIKLFDLDRRPREIPIRDALRFSDLLSKSTYTPTADRDRLWGQEIAILMRLLYPEDEVVRYYLGSSLSAVGNFRGLQSKAVGEYASTDILDQIFYEYDMNEHKIPGKEEEYFFHDQMIVYRGMNKKAFSYGDIEMSNCHEQATETDFEALRKFGLIYARDLATGDVTPISQTFDKYVDEKQRQRIIENFPIERTSEDITLSYDQAENLHDAIVKGMAYPELTGENDEIDFEKLVDFMWELRRLFKWDIYEKKTIGKRGNGDEKSVIRWYCTILLRWIRGNGLNTIVRSAVRYKENNPWTGVWSGDYMVEETYNPNSKYHKNLVIAESLSVIENVLLFSISNYFRKFSMEYKAVHQVENFDNDWYEYVEYGTTNPITIFLQQNGFSREASIYIQTPSNYSKYVTDVDGEKKIKRSILECGNIGVETEAQDIQFNIPELFVE